jgi:short-subunit dehydrogenase
MLLKKLKEKYGPWAVIAGGSQRIGEAYVRILGIQGINLVLLAPRKPLLDKLAKELEDEPKISVGTISADLADENTINKIREKTDDIEVNMLIYNAATEVLGPFFNSELKQHLTMLDVNYRSVLIFIVYIGRLMKERKEVLSS